MIQVTSWYWSVSIRLTLVLVAIVAIGCSEEVGGGGEALQRVGAPIYGHDVQEDNTSTDTFRSPVGQLVAAFAATPNDGKGCTATLIDTDSRDRLLTAAHCLCKDGALASAVTFLLPQSPNEDWHAVSWAVHPLSYGGLECGMMPGGLIPPDALIQRPHDLALITLEEPVPEDVVATPAAVFLGNTHDIKNGVWTDGAALVGFGGTVSYDSPEGGGDRRWGYLGNHYPSKVGFVKDPCGFYEFETHCNDHNEWEVLIDPNVNAVSAEGDSGGPLFWTLGLLVQPTIIGVDSGWYDWVDIGEADQVQNAVYASTGGGVGGLSGDNAGWIMEALGGDLDGDGTADIEDNCPPRLCAHRGLDISACWNIDQEDKDNDGFGDSACDNCPPYVCVSQGKVGGSCTNPHQRNADNDVWGDVCDLCPRVTGYQGTGFPPQLDGDGDGVGDQCDNCTVCVGCEDTANGFAPCVGDGVGVGSCAATDVVCMADSESGAPVLGHCSRQLDDQDKDGFGGQCDTCPDIRTPSGEDNSNVLAEQRETATRLGDVCDPVPLALLAEQTATEVDELLPMVQGDLQGPDDLVDLTGVAWLGRISAAQPSGGATIHERAMLRQCDCHRPDGSTIVDVDKCVGDGLFCDWTNPTGSDPLDGWVGMTMQQFEPTSVNVFPLDVTSTWDFNVWKPSGSVVNHFGLTWAWYADTQVAGRVVGRLRDANAPYDARTNPITTHGAVVAHVRNDFGDVLEPAREGGRDLRDVFRMIDTPLADRTSLGDVRILMDRFVCLRPGCSAWLRPDILDRPDPMSILARVSAPTLMVEDSSRVLAMRVRGDALDVTSRLSPVLQQMVKAPGSTVWMAPVEAGYRIRQNGAPLLAAVMSADLAAGAKPRVVLPRGSGLQLGVDEEPRDGRMATQSIGGRQPPSLEAVHGVFSGIERAVYLVGGPAQDSPRSRDIWRFDVDTSSWSRPAEAASVTPSSQVLDLAYDSARSTLYVLDVDDEQMAPGNHSPHLARLYAYDLQASKATLLASWPRVGLYPRVFLATEADGHLMLVAARNNNFTAWRLAVDGDRLRVDGVRAGPGLVLDRPVMGEQYLVLPVAKQGRLRYEELGPSGFPGRQPCTHL